MFKKSNVGDQLLIAVKLNKISEISRLVALGVDVDSRIDKNGKTALHYAAYKGHLLAVKALIEAGADLDLTDENGVTALHRAIIHGHTDIVHTLLGAGCSVDKIDENGNTALHEAAWNGYSKCAELLVAAKCNVNTHNRTGYTSLHLAAQNCHCTTLRVLLDGGCNPLVKNNYGDTPLHIAVRYGHVEVCNMLMETKMNISEQNNDGNTPLHIAASMGHEKLTEMLLKAGIATTEKNNVGDTARELAVRNGFKKIAKLLAPTRGDTLRMFSRKERKEKRRPHSADVSHLFSGTTDSTLTNTATQLWIPKPLSLDPDSKKEGHKRDFSSHRTWGRKRKDERKPKVLTIKYDEMCSIERDYIKRRNSSTRKSHKSHSRSSLKSQEEKVRSDPVLHHKSKKFHSLVKVDEKVKSAQSRDDLEVTLSPKKTKKDKGFFALFRSASDTDLNAGEQKNGVFGKKHKDKYPPAGEVMGNGYHHVGKEVKEKGETEETKEKKDKRKGDEKTEKKDRTSKKSREEEKEKLEKKERRKEKEKEKKQSRRDEKDGSESDCTICQEKRRKSREKTHSKETKQKEHRSKSEHRRPKDHKETDLKDKHDKTPADKRDEEKEHKKKKHHRDKERERDDHRDKDRERDHRDKEREKDHREKDRSRRDKNHKRKNEEHAVDLGQTPCNQTHCSTCEAQLSRLEAWQERCTSEIDSARRRLEHRLQRLEKKLEVQLSEERQLKDKENRDKEYHRVVGRVKDECREVSKNAQDSSGNVKEEIRGLIKGGLSKLELKLGQISRGYNIPFMDCQHRCNPELGRNCSVERGIRHVRSRSSPHLGRAPCEDCVQVLEHRAGGASPHLASFTPSENSSRATSGIRVSDSGSLDTVIEARPVGDKALHASGTIIEARPVDDEGLDTVIEAQPVVEDESVVKINDTYAATQVQHQRQVQEVEKWWRAKAEEEQRVLYARICELEQMLMMSRAEGDCFV